MRYRQALEALERRQETRIELGLSRVRRHLGRLGNPQRSLRCIHVAGTNGKGSVCSILESVLRAENYRTGLYTSPHLQDVRERIRVDGRAIPRERFAALLERTLKAERAEKLTYFELLTAVAFQYFNERRVEVVVLETGLGGRLDATNVVENPLASLITSIDFDHRQFLGDTVSAIASEKAGIIKRGRPVLCPPLRPAAMKVIGRKARALGAPLTVARPAWSARVDWRGGLQRLRGPDGERFELSLLGGCQPRNVALAYAALSSVSGALPVSRDGWRRGLARVRWPGRFDVRRLGRKTLILDGAHNVEAMAQLKRTLDRSPWRRGGLLVVLGVLKDKDAAGMIQALAPYLRRVAAVRPESPRAMDAAELAREIRARVPSARVTAESGCEAALGAWLREPRPAAALVCGSFYLVARAAAFADRLQKGARAR